MNQRNAAATVMLLCSFACAFAGDASAAEIRIRSDVWLPYNGRTTLDPPGYMIELADAIAKANGHTIDYAHMPWEAALDAVRSGVHDCVVGAIRSDAEDFAFPANSWGQSNNEFFARAENPWRYTGMDSLATVRLAVIDGYSYNDELDAYIEEHRDDPRRIVVVASQGRAVVAAISRLVSRTADVVVEDGNVGRSAIARLQLSERIVPVGSTDDLEDLYIACTPAAPRGKEWADMFSAGVQNLRERGELARILAKYSLSDWQQP
jgi:polar amino acid transport system substrate-binding protein